MIAPVWRLPALPIATAGVLLMNTGRPGTVCVTLVNSSIAGAAAPPAFEMLDRCSQLGLSATLATSNPDAISSDVRDSIVEHGHAIALLGEDVWLQASQGRFAQGLIQGTTFANGDGPGVATLVVDQEIALDRYQLLAKYGVRVVVPTAGYAVGQSTVSTSPFFGVWHIPATLHLPGRSRRKLQSDTSQTRRAVNKAELSGGLVHVVLDSRAADSSLCRRFAIVIEQIAEMKRRERLAVVTLGQYASDLSSRRAAKRPSRSILRAA